MQQHIYRKFQVQGQLQELTACNIKVGFRHPHNSIQLRAHYISQKCLLAWMTESLKTADMAIITKDRIRNGRRNGDYHTTCHKCIARKFQRHLLHMLFCTPTQQEEASSPRAAARNLQPARLKTLGVIRTNEVVGRHTHKWIRYNLFLFTKDRIGHKQDHKASIKPHVKTVWRVWLLQETPTPAFVTQGGTPKQQKGGSSSRAAAR